MADSISKGDKSDGEGESFAIITSDSARYSDSEGSSNLTLKTGDTDPNNSVVADELNNIDLNAEDSSIPVPSDTSPNAEDNIVPIEKLSGTDLNAEDGSIPADIIPSDTSPNAEDNIVPIEELGGSDLNPEDSNIPADIPSDTDPNARDSISTEKLNDTDSNAEDSTNITSILPPNEDSNDTGSNQASKKYATDSITVHRSHSVSNPTFQGPDSLKVGKPRRASEYSTDSPTMQTSDVRSSLSSLSLHHSAVEFIMKEGERFLEKPLILSKKLKISKEMASQALEFLKSSRKVEELELTPQVCKVIKTCLDENPDEDSHEDIALICEVDEELISKFFDRLPLNEKQKNITFERYNKGITASEISYYLKVTAKKIEDHIALTFLTFSGKEGNQALEIIKKYCGEISALNLREKIISKNLKLRDQLVCTLRRENELEFTIVSHYLNQYEESTDFLTVEMDLTKDEIFTIKECSKDSVEQLSVKLNKIESVIKIYLQQYYSHPVEAKYFKELQKRQIEDISKAFDTNFSLDDYRTIVTYSFDEIIIQIENEKTTKRAEDLLIKLLPLIFYYFKCSLPFEAIARLIANFSNIPLTTHDIFHLVFQFSDPVLRGLCIEHYSFSNAIPLYYPILKHPQTESTQLEFEICKELWYCLEQYNGLISFGLGRASWNAVGKSTFLDLIFESDFVKGSPQSSAFHFRSIDIQITKNLFGRAKKSHLDSTKWAYIDCHGYSDLSVIQVLCSHLDVALIHVCYNDYKNNKAELDKELRKFKLKHIYILIRDSECEQSIISTETVDESFHTYISIPDVSRKESLSYSAVKFLKNIGYKIFHLNIESPKLIQSEFMERVMEGINSPALNCIVTDNILIQNITLLFAESNSIDFKFLNYYSHFVEYMSSYHRTSYETDQNIIDKLALKCEQLDKKLKSSTKGDIVAHFNCVLSKDNSTLILCKLAQELLHISNLATTKSELVTEQKNDKYTLEILWRESILTHKYAQVREDPDNFALNYSEYVGSGEVFELIDGDNLRFFNQEIDTLLHQYYKKQSDLVNEINEGNNNDIKPAPIVVSIFGPQGSGKSTLLNYCFGCKFLTSAGRCTKGIYGSLPKLDRPINRSQSFLILDTEGLDGIERDNIMDTSMIYFDRTMVLFCLAVSQVVIINVKGDIGSEMQNLLQICAYSLNRLKVSKVKAPKIFFVLNQQEDPDPNKHLDVINLLMEKLNSESGLMETEGVKISDLIQVSRENLFILPSAFNSVEMNKPSAKIFDSGVIKLSPTIAFADKCTNLRLAIIEQLDHMPLDDIVLFQNMSEWMGMAGVVWDTIVKYQDIVRYKNLEELKCSNQLDQIVTDVMEKHFYLNKERLVQLTHNLCGEIAHVKSYIPSDTLLTEKMFTLDEIFSTFQTSCVKEFLNICQSDPLLRKMEHICNETASNLKRLIYVIRKQYEDQILLEIKSVLTEIELSDNMKKFQSTMDKRMDIYLGFHHKEVENAFEEIWKESFSTEDDEEELRECEENFSNLYSIFKMEYNRMENKQIISQYFRNYKFNMDSIIESIRSDILIRFLNRSFDQNEQFIYSLNSHHAPIKDMTTYNGRPAYTYLSQKTLYETESFLRIFPVTRLSLFFFIPSECKALLEYCSGYYNHPDIIWNPKKRIQVNILTSSLVDPEDLSTSTWDKFIKDISFDVLKLLTPNSDVSPAVVKKIIHALCFRIRLLNYEIGFIHASLSNIAERTLSNFVFAYAFKYHWQKKAQVRRENKKKREIKKPELFEYFTQKIEDHKMIKGGWNRDWMNTSDQKRSQKYALDFIESLKRGLKIYEQQNLINIFEDTCRKESLSHENMLALAYDIVQSEVEKDPKIIVTDVDNFVVQYICNRNAILQDLFKTEWSKVEAVLYDKISQRMASAFEVKISNLKSVINNLLQDLGNALMENIRKFESDRYFGFVDDQENTNFDEIKTIPFKAMNAYFNKYLDPTLTPGEFKNFFFDVFEVDGVKVRVCETYSLPSKHPEPVLDEDNFRKLVNTEMFNDTELIFNLYTYVENFLSTLDKYRFKLEKDEFQDIISDLKKELEKEILGCPSQCPSCGKFCERKIHPNEGKCQIKTGHQISSMGGNVWNADKDCSAIMFMCDDYKDDTQINLPVGVMKWGEFKDRYGSEWNWNPPCDEKNKLKQLSNPELMKNIWNKFGQSILDYHHQTQNTDISFVPYTTYEEVNEPLLPLKYYICFVIDGTGSMSRDISRVRISVGQLIKHFASRGSSSEFRVVIYRDHCDEILTETFPKGEGFTLDQKDVEDFLNGVVATGGGDFPEAVLDGLATAATESDWKSSSGIRNKVIHIFDAPPHGDFPNHTEHKSYSDKNNCCCCSTKCQFDWNRDVWRKFKRFNIEYHAINTTSNKLEFDTRDNVLKVIKKKALEYRHWITIDLIYKNYQLKMRKELGDLCHDFQVVGKEVVNDAILKIFVDYKKENDN